MGFYCSACAFFAICAIANGFSIASSSRPSPARVRASSSRLHAVVTYKQIQRVGFSIEVSKPLGVVFAENDPPFNGLSVVEVSEGGNGQAAGMQVGQQLLSVNRKSVVGDDFDTAMDLLRQGSDPLDVQLYDGTVRQLFTILKNVPDDDEEEEEFEEKAIVMDENYVSPVVVAEEDEPEDLSIGEVFGILKNAGAKMFEKTPEEKAAAEKSPPKKGGLFGMLKQDTIQLDGDDASGLN